MSTSNEHKSITSQEISNKNEASSRKSASNAIESKRSIIVEQANDDLSHTSSAKRFLQKQDEIDAKSNMASKKSQSNIVVQKEKDGKGALVSLGENHPLELLGLNVALIIVNAILVGICILGLPNIDLEGMPTFEFERMNTGVSLESLSKCMVASIAVPAIFLVIAWFLHRIPSTTKDANKEKRCSTSICKKEKTEDGSCPLRKFICTNCKLVFWTGYALAFLNAMQLMLCYCGLPGLPEMTFNLPEITLPSISFGLPDLSFELSSASWNARGSFNPCEYQMSCIALTSVLFTIPPFLLLSPLSPMYSRNGTEQNATKKKSIDNTMSGDKASRLEVKEETKSFAETINEKQESLFWVAYGLMYVNIILMIFCYCGIGIPSMPKICNIWPFALVCTLVSCVMRCLDGSRDEEAKE